MTRSSFFKCDIYTVQDATTQFVTNMHSPSRIYIHHDVANQPGVNRPGVCVCLCVFVCVCVCLCVCMCVCVNRPCEFVHIKAVVLAKTSRMNEICRQ